jgi:hypothetical protein
VGLPEGFDPTVSSRKGLRLMRALADQLGGRLDFEQGLDRPVCTAGNSAASKPVLRAAGRRRERTSRMKHSPKRFDVDRLSEDIRECYQLAKECARRAKAEADPQLRQDFLDMERRWLFLARSYEFTRQIGRSAPSRASQDARVGA